VVKKIIRAYLETLNEQQQDRPKWLREDDKTLTADQAITVDKGIRWKNTAENFAHFGLPGNGSIKVEPVEKMLERTTRFLFRCEAISNQPDIKALFDPTIMKEVREGWISPKDIVRVVPPPTVRREDCEPIADKKFDPVEFQTGSDEIPELHLLDLRDLAAELKNNPSSYLEIRGQATGKTESDRRLSRKRALAVSTWLQKEGVARERLFTVVETESVNPRSAVSFVLLKKKEVKSGP